MNKQDEFINDLRAVFSKHGAYIETYDEYDGLDNFVGQKVEIHSHAFDDSQRLHIFIDDIAELADIIKGENDVDSDKPNGEVSYYDINDIDSQKDIKSKVSRGDIPSDAIVLSSINPFAKTLSARIVWGMPKSQIKAHAALSGYAYCKVTDLVFMKENEQ